MADILIKITDKIRQEEALFFESFDRSKVTLVREDSPKEVLVSKEFFLIAECKKGSPSRGIIKEDYNPIELAKSYEKAGASAISVLTEKNFFHGAKKHLPRVKKEVSLPVLRKDFIIDEYQVYESYELGADMVLLIVACLEDAKLKELYELIIGYGMTPLVEVHDEGELTRALAINPVLVGINNRNLKTFDVDIETSFRLKKTIPDTVKVISESGISSTDDIVRLKKAGFYGALVGESILVSGNPNEKIKELLAANPIPSPSPKGEGNKNHPKIFGSVAGKIYEKLFPAAKEMRKNQTFAEEKLWEALRGKSLGVKFRRQHVMDNFIVDFYCIEKGIVVEVDGDIHLNQRERDLERDNRLISLGCKVARFSNEQVLNDMQSVLDEIREQLSLAPHSFRRGAGGEVRIKICGITNQEDFEALTNLGIDYAGFIFYKKSPRYVDPELVASFNSDKVIKVGVFVNASVDDIHEIFHVAGLDIVQLHSDEDLAFCNKLQVPYFKVIRVKDERSVAVIYDYPPNAVFLLDTFKDDSYGGTGSSINLDLISKALQMSNNIIVAGGVGIENIEEIMSLRPLGVDINSSVELSPGKKDIVKCKQIVSLIKQEKVKSNE